MPADRLGARAFLEQSEGFLRDADRDDLSTESRAVLLHHAAIGASDAILLAKGRRVTSGDGSHVKRLEAALALIDADTEELLVELDISRTRRAEASYQAQPVARASVSDALDATAELVALAKGLLAQ